MKLTPLGTAYALAFTFLILMALAAVLLFAFAPASPPDGALPPIGRVIYALVGASALGAVILLSALGATVVVKMAVGIIDLKFLVAEPDGQASLSRFQMLLFTFVIASLYFLYSLYSMTSGDGGKLPEIPGSVLGLMGISGGSYLLSKGISAASGSNAGSSDSTPVRKNIP
jgi:hypothetical protein